MEEATAEHKLARFLHCGTTDTCYKVEKKECWRRGLPGYVGEVHKVVDELVHAGHVLLPLQHVVKAHRAGCYDRDALLFALNVCIKIDNKTAKSSAYQQLVDIVHNADDFFDMLDSHFQVNKKTKSAGRVSAKWGMGRGMRTFIQRWYNKQDPYDLVMETCRVKKKHSWSHKDIIKLAHVKSSDKAVAVILMAIVQGLAKTVEMYKESPEAQPILDYIACVEEFKRCRDPVLAVQQIRQHSFDIDIVPSELLVYTEVWEAAVSRLPLRRVLAHLKSMVRHNLLLRGDCPVLEKVRGLVCDPLALAASKLQPAEILRYERRNVASGWKHPPTTNKSDIEEKEYLKTTSIPNRRLTEALKAMLKHSFKNVVKLNKKVLICVDTRDKMLTSRCWKSDSVTSSQAAAVTILSLVAAKCDVTLTTVIEGEGRHAGDIVVIPLTDTDNMETLGRKMREANGGVPKNIHAVNYAVSSKKQFDLILHITDSHTADVDSKLLWPALVKYRERGGTITRYVMMAVSTSSVSSADPRDPGMLDIAGWTPDAVRVIQAFLKEEF